MTEIAYNIQNYVSSSVFSPENKNCVFVTRMRCLYLHTEWVLSQRVHHVVSTVAQNEQTLALDRPFVFLPLSSLYMFGTHTLMSRFHLI